MNQHKRFFFLWAVTMFCLGAISCSEADPKITDNRTEEQKAVAFLTAFEKESQASSLPLYYAAWDYRTDLENTEKEEKYLRLKNTNSELWSKLREQARNFDISQLSPNTARQIRRLTAGVNVPPKKPEDLARYNKLTADMSKAFSKYKVCYDETEEDCLENTEVLAFMKNNKEPDKLIYTYVQWHGNTKPHREKYLEFVELSNQSARENGYSDQGAAWRSGYDMPADDFADTMEGLWNQVKPLYNSLHCHVRDELSKTYPEHVKPQGPLPAPLLGNMWAQSWLFIYDQVAGELPPSFNVTKALKDQNYTARKIAQRADEFFVSMGFAPMTPIFWEKSQFEKPNDGRKVQCHASAWGIDVKNGDQRIMMCTQIQEEDFKVMHHEVGHLITNHAYRNQPPLYRSAAHDGFHEGVGDLISLSMTPAYYKEIGLIDKEPDPSKDMSMLMKLALDKVAFLPWGYLVDKWRWDVFSGKVQPEDYNKHWHDLRLQYQGVVSPDMGKDAHLNLDPLGKYHVPANVPYARYFLAFILQYQFHKNLCEEAGWTGPLHRCTLYGNKKAGAKLNKMLALGASKPWQEVITEIDPSGKMDASGLLEYFAPLQAWLDEKNKGRNCGW